MPVLVVVSVSLVNGVLPFSQYFRHVSTSLYEYVSRHSVTIFPLVRIHRHLY